MLALTMPLWPLSFRPSYAREGGNGGGGRTAKLVVPTALRAPAKLPMAIAMVAWCSQAATAAVAFLLLRPSLSRTSATAN